jgi:hypothetical protein
LLGSGWSFSRLDSESDLSIAFSDVVHLGPASGAVRDVAAVTSDVPNNPGISNARTANDALFLNRGAALRSVE